MDFQARQLLHEGEEQRYRLRLVLNNMLPACLNTSRGEGQCVCLSNFCCERRFRPYLVVFIISATAIALERPFLKRHVRDQDLVMRIMNDFLLTIWVLLPIIYMFLQAADSCQWPGMRFSYRDKGTFAAVKHGHCCCA